MINLTWFLLSCSPMKISNFKFIIASGYYYFAVKEEKHFMLFFVFVFCFFTFLNLQPDKTTLLSMPLLWEKKNTGLRNHTAGLFNFLNYWVGLTAWSESIDCAEIDDWEGQLFSPGWPLSWASERGIVTPRTTNF